MRQAIGPLAQIPGYLLNLAHLFPTLAIYGTLPYRPTAYFAIPVPDRKNSPPPSRGLLLRQAKVILTSLDVLTGFGSWQLSDLVITIRA